jgi:dihydroneopterin aldolase
MDIIFLHGLRVECVIGCWEWERRITQTVLIDLDMGWDIAPATASDGIDDTLNYKEVSRRVTAVAQEGRFRLVETMAERVAAVLADEFRVPWCRVRVNKRGALSAARDVGVEIERGVRPDRSGQ